MPVKVPLGARLFGTKTTEAVISTLNLLLKEIMSIDIFVGFFLNALVVSTVVSL